LGSPGLTAGFFTGISWNPCGSPIKSTKIGADHIQYLLGTLFHWDVMATNRIAMNQPNQAAGVVSKLDATNSYSMIMKKVVNIGNPRILGQTPYALKMRYIPKILVVE